MHQEQRGQLRLLKLNALPFGLSYEQAYNSNISGEVRVGLYRVSVYTKIFYGDKVRYKDGKNTRRLSGNYFGPTLTLCYSEIPGLRLTKRFQTAPMKFSSFGIKMGSQRFFKSYWFDVGGSLNYIMSFSLRPDPYPRQSALALMFNFKMGWVLKKSNKKSTIHHSKKESSAE